MKTSKTLLTLTPLAAAIFSTMVEAAPMKSESKPVAQFFSQEVQANFELFGDTDDDKLIWYVPKNGSIAMLGNPANPVPRLNASMFTEFQGPFVGQFVALMGGSFSTAGFAPQRQQLQDEASDQGLHIAPAPARQAKTKFIVSGIETDGSLDVDCVLFDVTINRPDGSTFTTKMPECSVETADGEKKSADALQRFVSLPPLGQTTVSTSIPFQAKTTPEYFNVVQSNLSVGANFDESLSAVIDWEIGAEALTRTARVTLDWDQVFEQASSFAAIHNWKCVDIEVSAFFKRLVREGEIEVEYLNANDQWVDRLPNDAEFVSFIDQLVRELRDEVFAELRQYSESELGTVSREANAYFTLRTNYEKQIIRINETRIVNWNPGPTVKTARTDMFVGCLTGGFGLPVRISNDPACAGLFGIEQ